MHHEKECDIQSVVSAFLPILGFQATPLCFLAAFFNEYELQLISGNYCF